MTTHQIPPKLAAKMEELKMIKRKKRVRDIAAPRTFVKQGIYAGPTKPPRRIGSEDLDNAPSRYGNVLVYKDGRKENVDLS